MKYKFLIWKVVLHVGFTCASDVSYSFDFAVEIRLWHNKLKGLRFIHQPDPYTQAPQLWHWR